MSRIFPAATSAFTLAASLAFAPAAFAEEVTIETATGPATLEANPAPVAVYDMAALDMLDALGVEGLVSISNTYLDYLAAYKGDLGTLFEPDFEALNAAQPELIVAGGRSSSQVEALSALAPTIDMTVRGDAVLEEAESRLRAYGKLFDKEAKAEELIGALEAKLETARAAVEGKGTGLILMTNGGKISAYGAGGRYGWIHKSLGLPEVIEGLEDSTHGESVSFEFIREANPDWLLVLDRVAAIGAEGESARATLDNPLVAETTAWKEGQVVYLNAAETYIAGGGIQSIMGTLDLIETAFEGSAGEG